MSSNKDWNYVTSTAFNIVERVLQVDDVQSSAFYCSNVSSRRPLISSLGHMRKHATAAALCDKNKTYLKSISHCLCSDQYAIMAAECSQSNLKIWENTRWIHLKHFPFTTQYQFSSNPFSVVDYHQSLE